MTRMHTRREVLKIAAAGIAGTAAAQAANQATKAQGSQAEPGGAIQVWRTYGGKRYAREAAVSWQQASGGQENEIRLEPEQRYQEILGFGASFTDAACYMFHQLAPPEREQLLHELFHPQEMNLSVARLCIGSSDYATRVYSFDEGDPDPELSRFSIDHDREYILPVLRQGRQTNPDLFLLGSPWSPPGWMKANGTMLGGLDEKEIFRALRAVLREIPPGIRRRRSAGECDHRSK